MGREIVNQDGINVIIDAMKKHASSSELQQEAATALWRIVFEGGYQAGKAVIDAGGFEALDAARVKFSDVNEVQEAIAVACGPLLQYGLLDKEADEKEKDK